MNIMHQLCSRLTALSVMAGTLLTFTIASAAAQSELRFKGGIGVQPVSSGVAVSPTPATAPVVESVNRNIVRGVQPAGQIWVIDSLDAKVEGNHISVQGKGLVLGGGNNAGRATGQFVLATLICQAAVPFTENVTNLSGVPLSATGDFNIDGDLAPARPAICPSPMLLIRSAANLSWFAVGIFRP